MNTHRTLAAVLVLGLVSLFAVGCSPADKPTVVDGRMQYQAGSTRLTLSPDGAMVVELVTRDGARTMAEPQVGDALRPFDLVLGDEQVRWHFDFVDNPPQHTPDGYWVASAEPVGNTPMGLKVLFRADPAAGNGIEVLAQYANSSEGPIQVDRMVGFTAKMDASTLNPALAPSGFWAFLGGSYPERYDWITPIDSSFARENYQGMNAPDYGGGIPAFDLWTDRGALFVGSVSDHWRPLTLPVRGGKDGATVAVERQVPFTINADESWDAAPLLVLAHKGDAYDGLHQYGRVLEKHGLTFPAAPEVAYEPMWCAWGYERAFRPEEVYQTLPKVKELGYKWAGLDDGYQTANGDWDLMPSKFPRGDESMEAFVDTVHAMGLKAMLWWVPGDAAPNSDVAQQHPDWVVKNEDGSPAMISWWDTYYLDPANDAVLKHQRELVDKFLNTWGYDGLKTDGQCFNQVPPDYGNHPNDPWMSSRHSSDILRAIYEEAHADNPDAVIHNCPCGTVFNLYNMPYTDQYVASDPLSSWQIRTKNMVLRAIVGDKISYYGDHVELSTGGDDFASTVGTGGVPGSKFIWPKEPRRKLSGDFLLTPEREEHQKHWLGLYKTYMLSKAHYRSLYVLGFDPIEGYAFEKDGTMYYSFYADHYDGAVELRGLEPNKKYAVSDYDRGIDYGVVTGPIATIHTGFDHHLLLMATPE